jgi:hypothetical protein
MLGARVRRGPGARRAAGGRTAAGPARSPVAPSSTRFAIASWSLSRRTRGRAVRGRRSARTARRRAGRHPARAPRASGDEELVEPRAAERARGDLARRDLDDRVEPTVRRVGGSRRRRRARSTRRRRRRRSARRARARARRTLDGRSAPRRSRSRRPRWSGSGVVVIGQRTVRIPLQAVGDRQALEGDVHAAVGVQAFPASRAGDRAAGALWHPAALPGAGLVSVARRSRAATARGHRPGSPAPSRDRVDRSQRGTLRPSLGVRRRTPRT